MFTSGELRDLAKSIRGEVSEVATVIQGVVSRVDPAGTVWVLIGDNADPTPCAMDMACRPGDVVTVRIANHKATVIGNETAPATDDHAANVAHGVASAAQETADTAQTTAQEADSRAQTAQRTAATAAATADTASTAAQEAKDVARAVGQHFWHDTRGAHVTEEEREDYETQASGFQQLMTSIGTLFTKAVNGIEYLLRSDTQSGMAIYDGTCTADDANLAQHLVATFSAQGAQIGKSGESHAEIDSTSLQMVNRTGDVYMHVEDLNGDADNPIITDDTFLGDGSQTAFELSYAPSTIYEVHRDGSTITSGYSISGRTITFDTAPRYTAYVQYQTQEVVPCFTYGSRANGSMKGLSSVVEGIVNEASGRGAHAEGMYTIASDTAAHAEGMYNTADGASAHAEGQGTRAHGEGSHAEGQRSYAESFCSHAEGISTHTYGDASHAEGISTETSGQATHAEGYDTIARNVGGLSYQHVQGRWNIEDTQGKYAHIIGNGLSNGTRSNAHTVDWNGNAWYAGDISADGALSCEDGSPYCSDGTNVKCGGVTVGSADNLSYVVNGAQFVTRRIKSAVYSISGNGLHTSTITCPTISGYTPLAVIGYQNNHGNYLFPVAVYMNNGANTVTFINKNWTSTSFTDALDIVTVLYAKTGLVDRDESW